MRWLIAIAVIFAVVIFGPDFAGQNATPLAIWQGATMPKSVQNLRIASFVPIPQLPEALVEADTASSPLRKFYEELGLGEDAQAELTPEQMCEKLASAAAETGIPAPFFARLIWQESRFDPRAVSPVGAQGVAQFMPKVAASMGLDDPFDPRAALPMSAQLLQTLYRTFGNLGLAAAAYNAGPKRIQDWLARRGKLPEETRNYVRVITGHPVEKWTVASSIDLPLDLPRAAPCHGVAGLSRSAGAMTIPVKLDDSVVKLIEEARAREARIRQAKAKRAIAAARRANAAKAAIAAKQKAKGRNRALAAKSQDRVPSHREKVATAR